MLYRCRSWGLPSSRWLFTCPVLGSLRDQGAPQRQDVREALSHHVRGAHTRAHSLQHMTTCPCTLVHLRKDVQGLMWPWPEQLPVTVLSLLFTKDPRRGPFRRQGRYIWDTGTYLLSQETYKQQKPKNRNKRRAGQRKRIHTDSGKSLAQQLHGFSFFQKPGKGNALWQEKILKYAAVHFQCFGSKTRIDILTQ